MFCRAAAHHMSCCVGPHHWVATRGASHPPWPDASSHAVAFGAATWQHPSAAGWGIWSCLTDCPRQHCSSSSPKAIACHILTTGLYGLPACVCAKWQQKRSNGCIMLVPYNVHWASTFSPIIWDSICQAFGTKSCRWLCFLHHLGMRDAHLLLGHPLYMLL